MTHSNKPENICISIMAMLISTQWENEFERISRIHQSNQFCHNSSHIISLQNTDLILIQRIQISHSANQCLMNLTSAKSLSSSILINMIMMRLFRKSSMNQLHYERNLSLYPSDGKSQDIYLLLKLRKNMTKKVRFIRNLQIYTKNDLWHFWKWWC